MKREKSDNNPIFVCLKAKAGKRIKSEKLSVQGIVETDACALDGKRGLRKRKIRHDFDHKMILKMSIFLTSKNVQKGVVDRDTICYNKNARYTIRYTID